MTDSEDMRRRIREAIALGHAVTDGEWPDQEQSREILADYIEGHDVPEDDTLPADPDPGQED